MTQKPVLRQYSLGERVTLSGLFMVLACVLAWLAFGLLQTSWQAHQLDQRFEREGVQTQGYVSGFRYVAHTGKYGHQNSGDYPIVTIDTPKGAFQIPTSYEHPLNKAQQDKLLWQKVDVVYLRDEPSIGRVVKWHGSWMWVLTSLGVFILAASLFVLYMAYRMLALKNESLFKQ
jgi:predicted metal-binding membrane protein